MRVGSIRCANVKMILSRSMVHVYRYATMAVNIWPVVFVEAPRYVMRVNGIIKTNVVHVRHIQQKWKMVSVEMSLGGIVCAMMAEQQIRIYQVQMACHAADAQVIHNITVNVEPVCAKTKIIHIMKHIIVAVREPVSVVALCKMR